MKEGEFVEIDYTGRILETGKVFDTTDKKIAEENKLDLSAEYKPKIIVAGQGFVIKGLDKAILEHKIGDEFEIELKPENAFGNRNAQLIKLIPTRVFKKKNMIPSPGMEPGMQVNIDGLLGIVRTTTGGRCIVDFNHPLAGKSVKYKVKIIKTITEKKEQARALADFYGLKDINFEFDKEKIQIITKKTVPEQIKKILADKMQKHLNLKEIDFVEKFKKGD